MAGPCAAHDLLVSELDRVKDNQSELYELDRKRSDDMSEIRSDIATLKSAGSIMQKDIEDLKTGVTEVKNVTSELKNDIIQVKSSVSGMQLDISKIKESIQGKKWKPADYVAIIVAFISMIGTVAVTIITVKGS